MEKELIAEMNICGQIIKGIITGIGNEEKIYFADVKFRHNGIISDIRVTISQNTFDKLLSSITRKIQNGKSEM